MDVQPSESASYMVVTGLGRDRSGIMAALSGALYQLGGNIQDSTASVLRGQFATIMIVRFPTTEDPHEVEDGLAKVAKAYDLSIFVREARASEVAVPRGSDTKPFLISVLGKDQPGIFNKLAKRLGNFQANITGIKTQIVQVEGKQVYAMVVEVDLPLYQPEEDFIFDLKSFGTEIGADINVKPFI